MGILIRETRLRQAQTDTRKPHDKLKYKCHAELAKRNTRVFDKLRLTLVYIIDFRN